MYYKQWGTIHKWCVINIEVGVLVECCECCLCVGQLHWGFSQFEVSWPSVSHQRFHGKNVSYVWQSLSSGSVCLSLSLGQSLDGVLIAQPHIKPECFLLGFVVQLGNTDMHNVCVCVRVYFQCSWCIFNGIIAVQVSSNASNASALESPTINLLLRTHRYIYIHAKSNKNIKIRMKCIHIHRTIAGDDIYIYIYTTIIWEGPFAGC